MAELTKQQKDELDNLEYYTARAGDVFNSLADSYHKVGRVAEVKLVQDAVKWLGRATFDPVKLGSAYAKDGAAGVASTYLMDKAGQLVGGMITNGIIVSATGGSGLLAGIMVGTAVGVFLDAGDQWTGSSDLLTNAFKRVEMYLKDIPPGKIDPSGATVLEKIVVVSNTRSPIVDLLSAKAKVVKELQSLSTKTGYHASYKDLVGMNHSSIGELVGAAAQKLKGPPALVALGKLETAINNVLDAYEAHQSKLDEADPTLAAEMGKMMNVIRSFSQQTHKISPLVIDLDGDGIHSLTATEHEARFDFGDEGNPIMHGWLSKGDAFLALDKNANGTIDNISELFGSRDTDGYTLLQRHDDNASGGIDAADAIYDQLLVWQDVNSDGVSQAEELRSLSDAGIVHVSLEVVQQNVSDNGNWLPLSSSVTMVDGSLKETADIYFSSVGLKSQQIEGQINPDSLVIQGTDSDDALHASGRDQVIFGGKGGDTFVFSERSGRDLIVDFESGVDKIDVSAWNVASLEDVLVAAYEGGIAAQHPEGLIKVANVSGLSSADFVFARQSDDPAA